MAGLITFTLLNNYPNPFNPRTIIRFETRSTVSQVHLSVFDVLGREIKTLVQEQLSPGAHEAVWDGTDKNGLPVASGVYFYRLRVGNKHASAKKMLLLR